MPEMRIYLPPRLSQPLEHAAKSLCLSKPQFIRAVLSAALNELQMERPTEEGEAGQRPCEPSRQPPAERGAPDRADRNRAQAGRVPSIPQEDRGEARS